MKWLVLGAVVTLSVMLSAPLVPSSEGLFFNPGEGFSVGGVHVSVDQQAATVSPGGTAVFNITIANDSEFPVLINATMVSLSRWKTRIDPSFLLLGSHEVAHIILRVTAPENANNGTIAQVTVIYAITFPETGESMNAPTTSLETVVDDGGTSSSYYGIVIIAGTGIGLAVFLFTDKGQYLGSMAIAPLYTRIHKEKILKNEIRNGLFNHIRENPGQCFSELKRELSLNNGVLAHHLKTLEREHYIKSRKDGLYRRFFLRNQPVPTIILNRPQRGILSYLIQHPGVPQSKVALHLGVSRQTVNYHMQCMEEMGAVRISRNGRRTMCYPLVRPGPEGGNSGFAK